MESVQLWSDLAEIVAGLGVVVTLAVLVAQVRDARRATEENTRLLRAAAFDRGFDQLSQWRGRLIESPDIARLWQRGNRGEPLSEEDAARYAELATDLYMARTASYRRHAAIGNQELATGQLRLIADLCTHPGFRTWFEAMPETMRGDVWRGVRTLVANPSHSPATT